MEENIRWADAFVLAYSVTDRSSFEECLRLKFLINYARKNKNPSHVPIYLVGNQNDLEYDRMVSQLEGRKMSKNLECTRYYDISARENVDEVTDMFHDLYRTMRTETKFTRLNRSLSPKEKNIFPTEDTLKFPDFPKDEKRDHDSSFKRIIIRSFSPRDKQYSPPRERQITPTEDDIQKLLDSPSPDKKDTDNSLKRKTSMSKRLRRVLQGGRHRDDVSFRPEHGS